MVTVNTITITWFLAGSGFIVLLYLLWGMRKDPARERLEDLTSVGVRGTPTDLPERMRARNSLPSVTTADKSLNQWTSRRLHKQERAIDLRQRLTQAGFYTPVAAGVFIAFRIVLLVGPAVLGFLAGRQGYLPMIPGILFGAIAGIAGTLAPSFWLDHVKRSRQSKIRRALPDALDVMVVCLEGGLSLPGTLSRVAHELVAAHALLAVELKIVERQMQLGRSAGEAIREFANRFDLEELRSMAAVIVQAERIGSSVVGALEVYAGVMRLKRQQRAEEMAHKAGVKILFPTIFCIFPAIFVVILGPAAINIYHVIILGVLRRVVH